MKIGVLSDTHNELDRTKIAVRLLQSEGVDILVHCGDLSTTPILRACNPGLPLYFVFGNHDSDNAGSLREASNEIGANCLGWGGEFSADGTRIAVTHGHLRTERERLLKTSPDILLSGHSHIAEHWIDEDVWRINPGALYRAREYTVAVIDTVTESATFCTIDREANWSMSGLVDP